MQVLDFNLYEKSKPPTIYDLNEANILKHKDTKEIFKFIYPLASPCVGAPTFKYGYANADIPSPALCQRVF